MATWLALLTITAVLTVLSGLATATRNQQPDTALRFLPSDAHALARRADQTLLVGGVGPANIARARADARSALAHDATLPSAWRVLALTNPDGSAPSIRLLEIAQRLSRRDVATQLALLELQVSRGDIVGALRHYDVILRISTTYDPVLFPVLASAIAEPQIRQVLGRRLLQAPMWRRRFLAYMVNAGTPYDVQADLFSAMAAAGALPDRDIVATQATNSALGGQYAAGERFYRLVSPAEVAQPLRDGGFEKEEGVPPFDWQLDTDSALSVAVNASSTGRRLEIASERGDGGRGARQLVSLSPGRHRVSASFGAIDGRGAGIPYMNLTCAEGGTPIAAFDGVAGRTRFGGDIAVPAECRLQWLELGLRQDPNGAGIAVWIDTVEVDRSAAGQR